jgi:YfiR/HmsC-like
VLLVLRFNRRPVTRQELVAAGHRFGRRRVCAVRLALILTMTLAPYLFAPCPTSAQASVSAEYRAKANFLIAFPSFIDWPESAFLSAQAPFVVCVLGDFRFGTVLVEFARTTLPHGRRVDVRWVRQDQEVRNCQILFVSQSEVKRYAAILQSVQGRGILTVGETRDFLGAGGMVSFLFQDEGLQFEVNLAATNEAHLRVSSRLLVLARRVLNNPDSSNDYATTQKTSRKVE